MTTLNISCQTAVQPAISFNDLYNLKNEWLSLYNNIELNNELFIHLTELMDSINNDVLKQNKQRYKQYQRQKQGEDLSPNWRTLKPGTKPSALSSQLEGADKSKLVLNRELNKLSPSNVDVILSSVLQVFTDFITASILANGTQSELNKTFYTNWDIYIKHLWHLLINKTLTQTNYSDIYFKFMNKLTCVTGEELLDKWKNDVSGILSEVTVNKILCELSGKIGFQLLEANKRSLINEMISFMKNSNYLATNNLLYELLGDVMNNSCENIFNTLGKFVKFFTDTERGRKLSRAEKTAYDVLLLALYDNFKTINDLVQWEPINTDELEKRVYFTIGFFNDNRRFIQGLDMDFYRDMECQLDSLKRTDTVPTTIKYKLFDCIDNFINCRLNKQ